MTLGELYQAVAELAAGLPADTPVKYMSPRRAVRDVFTVRWSPWTEAVTVFIEDPLKD